MDKYKYLFIDAQYYLVRASYMLLSTKGDSKIVTYSDGTPFINDKGERVSVRFPNFDYTDIMQSLFYSVAKLARENPTRKVILLFDKSPYWRTLMVKEYKSSRVYYTDTDLAELNQDDDPVKFFQVKAQVEFNNIKNHAKFSVCKFFPQFGMPIYIVPHYEADDLAYMLSKNCSGLNEKVALCTVDSDWKYRLTPNSDMITPKGKVITYNEVVNTVPAGWDIYEYHKYHDAFGLGHNDLNPVLTEEGSKMGVVELRSAFESGDVKYFTDPDMIKVQLSTFDIDKFDDYESVNSELVDEKLELVGSYISNYSEFTKSMFFKIGWRYYMNFLNTLDLSLYNKK